MSTLVPAARSDLRDIQALGAQIEALHAALGERLAELDRVRTELAAFNIQYRHKVGRLHEQLDDLEAAIAELELGEIDRRLQAEGAAPAAEPVAVADAVPRLTSDAVRKLFRDVARAIHPDLAQDADARRRRHALMVEANRAYAVGDAARLRAILATWERSPEAVQGTDAAAERLRLAARAAELEAQLAACETDLADCLASPLWNLKVMVDEAAAAGKDLVADMVRRLRRDILAASNRLDAMRR